MQNIQTQTWCSNSVADRMLTKLFTFNCVFSDLVLYLTEPVWVSIKLNSLTGFVHLLRIEFKHFSMRLNQNFQTLKAFIITSKLLCNCTVYESFIPTAVDIYLHCFCVWFFPWVFNASLCFTPGNNKQIWWHDISNIRRFLVYMSDWCFRLFWK